MGSTFNFNANEAANEGAEIGLTTFGEMRVAERELVADMQFVYDLMPQQATTTTANSGTVTHTAPTAVLSTSTNTAGSASVTSKRVLSYVPGQGTEVLFTAVFATGVADSLQVFGAGDTATDGYFVGYDGATFGFFRYSGGVKTFTAQSSWNVDKFDGTGSSGITIDPTKGNIYRIRYGWLGYANIVLEIYDAEDERFHLCNVVRYANANTTPHLGNPTLALHAEVTNSGNATDLVAYVSSMGLSIEGKGKGYGVDYGVVGETTAIGTAAFIPVLSIRGATTINSITSRLASVLTDSSTSVDGTKPAEFALFVDPTLTGASWSLIHADSGVEYDTTATAYSATGRTAHIGTLAKSDSHNLTVNDFNEQLTPGGIWSVGVKATSGTTDAVATFNIRELR